MSSASDELKKLAAHAAIEEVRSGMVVGLGHGSTAHHGVVRLAELLESGVLRDIRAIACSRQVQHTAAGLGIPMTTLDEHPIIDLTIDGADEVDADLNLIKGGRGALLREKIVAQASRREIIVVHQDKLSQRLGEKWAVPIEVVEFGLRAVCGYLRELGGRPRAWMDQDGKPFRTDQGNPIVDCNFGPIDDPVGLATQLQARAGIVAHGLFVGLADKVIVAGRDGVRSLQPSEN